LDEEWWAGHGKILFPTTDKAIEAMIYSYSYYNYTWSAGRRSQKPYAAYLLLSEFYIKFIE
jgi:hypothetical protein